MVRWRLFLAGLGIALAFVGVWLLAASPDTEHHRRAWRPGEVVAVTEDTGEREWSWSFRLPNDSARPIRAEASFLLNISVARGDDEGEWKLVTLLKVDGEQVDGYSLGGTAFSEPGNWDRWRLDAHWSVSPGHESVVEATMKNEATPVPGRDWQVDYDPMQFEVTTTTKALDWALAGPGTGLVLAGFAAVGAVAVPTRTRLAETEDGEVLH